MTKEGKSLVLSAPLTVGLGIWATMYGIVMLISLYAKLSYYSASVNVFFPMGLGYSLIIVGIINIYAGHQICNSDWGVKGIGVASSLMLIAVSAIIFQFIIIILCLINIFSLSFSKPWGE